MKSLAVRVLGDPGVDGVEPQALQPEGQAGAAPACTGAAARCAKSDVLTDALGVTRRAKPDDQLAV
jgi:hypothetical protein